MFVGNLPIQIYPKAQGIEQLLTTTLSYSTSIHMNIHMKWIIHAGTPVNEQIV
jgi:hypothetical protein